MLAAVYTGENAQWPVWRIVASWVFFTITGAITDTPGIGDVIVTL